METILHGAAVCGMLYLVFSMIAATRDLTKRYTLTRDEKDKMDISTSALVGYILWALLIALIVFYALGWSAESLGFWSD